MPVSVIPNVAAGAHRHAYLFEGWRAGPAVGTATGSFTFSGVTHIFPPDLIYALPDKIPDPIRQEAEIPFGHP